MAWQGSKMTQFSQKRRLHDPPACALASPEQKGNTLWKKRTNKLHAGACSGLQVLSSLCPPNIAGSCAKGRQSCLIAARPICASDRAKYIWEITCVYLCYIKCAKNLHPEISQVSVCCRCGNDWSVPPRYFGKKKTYKKNNLQHMSLTWFQPQRPHQCSWFVCLSPRWRCSEYLRLAWDGMRRHGVHIRKVEWLFLTCVVSSQMRNISKYLLPKFTSKTGSSWSWQPCLKPMWPSSCMGNSSLFNRNVYHQMSPFHVTVWLLTISQRRGQLV